MLRSRLFFVPGFLGFCLFLLAPTLAEAQHGGHGGGGHGGGGHHSGGGGHHYGGGGHHYGGGNYYGGGFGYGLGSYGLGGYGLGGLSYGLGGYGYGLNSYGSGLGYGGSYYASPIYRNPGVSYYNSYYPPIVSPSPSYYSAPPALPQAPPSNEARVEAVLPVPDAQVWINGHKTSSVGTRRLYNSPALEPGSPYTYQVTAVWMQNGSEVRVERSVEVFPGLTSLVDFTKVNTSDRTPPPGN